MEATRLHRVTGTSFDGPVDVLGIARQLDLVLMMQPLDNLLGFYVKKRDIAGVVINSRIPESLQRFTLAHEIGHHVLGHNNSIDDNEMVNNHDPSSVEEVQAQAFAASLLMPLPLVNRAMRQLPAVQQDAPLGPADAYIFARQLGVSFSAGVWALQRQRLLNISTAKKFIKRGSLAAKSELLGSDQMENSRADAWVLGEESNNIDLLCRVGDEIHVHLSESSSTGRAWEIRDPAVPSMFDPSGVDFELDWEGNVVPPDPMTALANQLFDNAHSLQVLRDEYESPTAQDESSGQSVPTPSETQPKYPEPGGTRHVLVVPRQPGPTRLTIALVRPWDRGAPPVREYSVGMSVRPQQLGEQGLLSPELDSWVAQSAATA